MRGVAMKRIRRILLCILMITVLCGISVVGNSVVNSENKSKEKKRTTITKEEVKEWAAPDEEMLEYYNLGKFSTTLPVIYMNTKGQQILKENVICGHLIPAGTGQREFEKLIVGSKEEYDRILANKKTVLDYNEVE